MTMTSTGRPNKGDAFSVTATVDSVPTAEKHGLSPVTGDKQVSSKDCSPQLSKQDYKDTTLPRLASKVDSEDWSHQHVQPPMQVIVVPAPQGDISASAKRQSPHSIIPSIFSKPFRLQPRNAMTGTTTGQDGAIRGRKRSANVMDATATMNRDAMLTAPKGFIALSEAVKQEKRSLASESSLPQTVMLSGIRGMATGTYKGPSHTPPRDKRRLEPPVINFHCLSLQSPKRRDPSASPPTRAYPCPAQHSSLAKSGSPANHVGHVLHPSSSSSSCGTAPQLAATVPSGSVRSSFTPVYNAASPGGRSIGSFGSGSIGSNNARMNLSGRVATSYSPGSVKSSPKIAPLTVLKDSSHRIRLPQREDRSQRPPLPGASCINSLWLSLDNTTPDSSNNGEEDMPNPQDHPTMWPPRTVHCRRPSSDSISTVQNSVLSPMSRPSPMLMTSPHAFSSLSPSTAGMPRNTGTPRSKQHLFNELTSPSQRTPRTPLPRVTLTPRSNTSRGSRQSGHGHQNGLPRFPSPSDADNDMDVTSIFLSTAAASSLPVGSNQVGEGSDGCLAAICPSFPASSNSLALSADGSTNEAFKEAAAAAKNSSIHARGHSSKVLEPSSPCKSSPRFGELSGGSFMGIHTTSLLTPARSGGIMQAMMEATWNGDLGSVSDIDDDEDFILASPSAIEQERFASCQPARQRRRRSYDRSSPCSANASNSNLAGMNYIASSTSLFGMDIAHPPEVLVGPLPDRSTSDESAKSPRQLSATAHDPNKPQRPLQDNCQFFKRRKSDASFASIGLTLEGCAGDSGGRDLVTPPAMSTPQTPPPLQPKIEDVTAVFMPQGTYRYMPPQATSVCVAGADRKSVTMAIARMAFEAQRHAESSPAS